MLAALCMVALSATSPLSSQPSGKVVVLLNARNPTPALTKTQLRNLFQGTTSFWHGVVPVKVFVRAPSTAAAKAFLEPFVGQSPQAFAKHWDKLQLAGRGVAPVTMPGPVELSQAIAKTPGGIGFALASEPWQQNGVKAVPIK
ncbi:MAG: hypothetical protein OXU20_04160 [Myxococcales bacterium]|nr:hypothetical protein [Myxococcales bacterium]